MAGSEPHSKPWYRKAKVLLLCAIAVAAAAWLLSRPGDEQLILQTLEQARALGEVPQKLHPLEAAKEAKQLAGFFTESVTFRVQLKDLDELRIVGRKELQQRALAAKTQLQSLELQIRDPEITIRGSTAEVELTASALGSLPKYDGKFFELHRLALKMSEEGGEWKIAEVSHLKNLREQ